MSMSNLDSAVCAEKEYITKLTEQLITAIEAAPAGSLNISHNKGRTYFYQNFPGQNVKKVRIPNENIALICALAQKDYDMKVLRNLLMRKMALEKMESLYPQASLEDIYKKMPPERKALVKPVMLTDEQFVSAWQNLPFPARASEAGNKSYYQAKKEKNVRTASEMLIADCLLEMGVPYKYKYPLESHGKIIYPDFTLLNVKKRLQIYLEYSGEMDVPENAENFAERLEIYRSFNIFPGQKLIIITESSSRALDKAAVEKILEYYFTL